MMNLVSREMWSLMDLDDSLSMTLFELEKGIATISQSEELFDCFPAVNAAYDFTKSYNNIGKCLDENDENENQENIDDYQGKGVGEKKLEYGEFAIFLHALTQYYSYCQVLYYIKYFAREIISAYTIFQDFQ